MTHQPRPFDQFLKKLPELEQLAQLEWHQRQRLDAPMLHLLEQAGVRLDPAQKAVLRRHPAFQGLRQEPSFRRLTHQAQIRSRSLLRRLLHRR